MDFGLSDEQELLQETVRDFVAKECPPTRVRTLFDGEEGHDSALWKGLAEMGLAGLAIPEALGGAGLELLELALVCEALGAGAVPGPFLSHSLAGLAILIGGSDAQRERWLPRLASGEAIGTVALAEPGDVWGPEGWTSRLEAGRASGSKTLVPFGSLADVFVVGIAGGELALVERGAQGSRLEPLEGVDRTRRVERLSLEGTPCEVLPDGRHAAPRLRDAGLVLLAADSFGCGWTLLQDTIRYLRQRRQFGTPIVHFQGVKHDLAGLAAELEPSRSLYWYAAHAFDHSPEEAERVAALAKSHITDRAMSIARHCVELHGGIGFTWDCDIQIWFKRAMFNRGFLGSPDFHRERCARLAGW